MKYCGGKFRLRTEIAGELVQYIPVSNTFIDMFCGSCNIAVALKKLNPNITVFCNDINPYLISMFNAVKNGWIPPDDLTEDQWTQIKQNKDVHNPLTAFAGFGCSYGGDWFNCFARDNQTNRNFAAEAKRSIENDRPYLEQFNYSSYDYKNYPLPKEPTLVYCDIPYYSTRKSSYLKENKIEFDYKEFYSWCELNKAKGHTIIVSEYYNNIRATQYNYNIIWSKCSTAHMNNIGGSGTKTIEVLIKI